MLGVKRINRLPCLLYQWQLVSGIWRRLLKWFWTEDERYVPTTYWRPDRNSISDGYAFNEHLGGIAVTDQCGSWIRLLSLINEQIRRHWRKKMAFSENSRDGLYHWFRTWLAAAHGVSGLTELSLFKLPQQWPHSQWSQNVYAVAFAISWCYVRNDEKAL